MTPEEKLNRVKSILIDIENAELLINGKKYEEEIIIGVPDSFDAMDWTHRLLINSNDRIESKGNPPRLEVKFTEGSGDLRFIPDRL